MLFKSKFACRKHDRNALPQEIYNVHNEYESPKIMLFKDVIFACRQHDHDARLYGIIKRPRVGCSLGKGS